MLAFSHTIVSAAIGDSVNNAPTAFALGVAGHFFCDWLLHWNFYPHKHKHIGLLAAGDVAAGLGAAYFLLGADFWKWPVLAAIFGGLLPDMIAFTAYFFKFRVPYFSAFHDNMQNETESFWKGMISQIAVIALSIFFILR